eukprot:scaffold244610_cov15-Prasinocladus_malaysianus.AAC.1
MDRRPGTGPGTGDPAPCIGAPHTTYTPCIHNTQAAVGDRAGTGATQPGPCPGGSLYVHAGHTVYFFYMNNRPDR